MHVSFIPTITVSCSADEWQLYGGHDPEQDTARNLAAVRLSEAAGEALTLAWTALSGDTRVARAMGLPAATLEAIDLGMTVRQAADLAYRHWDNVADGLDGCGASDTEPRNHFAMLVEHYLRESPSLALEKQAHRRGTSPETAGHRFTIRSGRV